MKFLKCFTMISSILSSVLLIGATKSFAADKAHSSAPASPVVTSGPSGTVAAGESMQGVMSPQKM